MKKIVLKNYKSIFAVFLAFLGMVLASYYYVGGIVQQQIRTVGEEVIYSTQLMLNTALREAELLILETNHEVGLMIDEGRSDEEIDNYLRLMYERYGLKRLIPDLISIYGYIRGLMFVPSQWEPPSEYSPEERLWYVGAMKNEGGIYHSEPYISARTLEPCISVSQRLTDANGQLQGAIGVDINLNHVINYIRSRENAHDVYGILLDADLRIIDHPNRDLIGQALTEPGIAYSELGKALSEQGYISAERFRNDDGVDSLAFFRPMINGWYMGVIFPRDSFYQGTYSMLIGLSALGFVLMLLLSAMLIRIQAAQIRSEEESRTKSYFLARMSHEMRTPMNAIIGMASIASKESITNEAQRCLHTISDASVHLLSIINNLLDMSAIDSGKMKLMKQPFKFEEMLKKALDHVRPGMEQRQQRLELGIGENVPQTIATDEWRLTQVLVNLLDNAGKFTAEGGQIRLSVDMVQRQGSRCELLFEVEDNGIGISEDERGRLFDIFEQGDNSVSRKYGGTGLGLAISKSIIDMMEGQIWLESALGKGSKFSFTIWADIETAAQRGGMEDGSLETSSIKDIFLGKRMLLVDDVSINREIFASLLEETGIHIDCAENGREACEKFAANPESYDIIFMDIHMPEMNGYEATKYIRSMKGKAPRQIPIIAVTADVVSECGDKCTHCGMNGYINKPLDMAVIISTIKSYLLS